MPLSFHIELARNHLVRDSVIMDVPVHLGSRLALWVVVPVWCTSGDGRLDGRRAGQSGTLECTVILNDKKQCVDKRLQTKTSQRQAHILATDAGFL